MVTTPDMAKFYLLVICKMIMLLLVTGLSSSDLTTSNLSDESLSALTEPEKTTEDTVAECRPILRIINPLRNVSVISGERLILKCKVEDCTNANVQFQWYFGSTLFKPEPGETGVSVTNKRTQSRLRIDNAYSYHTGLYRCEATNGRRRVHTQAYVDVSFKPPPTSKPTIPPGKCETYSGIRCRDVLGGKSIYVDPYVTQKEMEDSIRQALQLLDGDGGSVSKRCFTFAYPTFCNFVFPSCEQVTDHITGKIIAKPTRLCREDCEQLKYDVCRNDLVNSPKNSYLRLVFQKSNCSILPATRSQTTKCIKVGLPAVVNRDHKCYNETGTSYRGTINYSKDGRTCKEWPHSEMTENPELAGGHNFCRNPNNALSGPWCYVNKHFTEKALCDVEKCSKPSRGSDMIMILVPSVSIPFVLACIGFAFCVCRKRKARSNQQRRKSPMSNVQSVELPLVSKSKAIPKVPDIVSSSIQLLNEVGDGHFGKVYKAKILPNPQFSTNFAVAVKTLREGSIPPHVDDFQREIEVFSELQHENVACLKAIVTQSSLRCMIFEYTNGVDLHEFLVLHSPQADFAKPPISSSSSHASSTIEHTDFVRMAIQIASGMEYLASNNFVHRDLAARNILVCSSMDLKISNLGVVRDSYLSCYYRSPQGGQLLPIRWMAPESLQSWQFSNKSSVWSFGALLWEMFSYGMQPYCGYNNHEVLDMISRRQLLTCPDQCPAKVYSLMHECWAAQPPQRPSFKDLRAKLQGWEASNNGRVTSQLAQGIHRQLQNVMRDGPAPYSQYTSQTSSIGGSSGLTYSSNVPGPTPSPPPQYSSMAMPMPSSSASTFMTTQHPMPPNVSPSSQQFFSSPGTNSSYPQSGTQHPYQPAYTSAPQSGGIYGENYAPHSQNQYMQQMQQRKPMNYRKGAASKSSGDSSSCASSSRDQFPPVRPYGGQGSFGPHDFNDSSNYEVPQGHHQHGGYNNHMNRPLSGVIENESGEDETPEKFYQNPQNNQETEKLVVSAAKGQHQVQQNALKLSPSGQFREIDSDISNSSIKATSCDSGLPVDDVESHLADPKTPLVGRGQPRHVVKTPLRGSTPRKFV